MFVYALSDQVRAFCQLRTDCIIFESSMKEGKACCNPHCTNSSFDAITRRVNVYGLGAKEFPGTFLPVEDLR